jgi:hypothetical protein
MAKKRASGAKTDQAANLGFEAKLWLTADSIEANLGPLAYRSRGDRKILVNSVQ